MDDSGEMGARRRAVKIGAPEPDQAAPRAMRWNPKPWLTLVGIALGGLAILEAALSGTALITPIPHSFLYTMRGLGVLIGLAVGVTVVVGDRELGWFRKTLTVLFLPFMSGFLFDGLAWRIADRWEFGLSSAPFSAARYPIDAVDHGRKGSRDTIEIDPFGTGEATHIPVPPSQYRALYGQASDFCVIVEQRRSASGAIEIRSDGEFTLTMPEPIAFERCAAPAR